MSDFQLNEWGIDIEVETLIDLTGFSNAEVHIDVEKPDGTQVTWAASILSVNDADRGGGVLTYTLQNGDIAVRGQYKAHARVTTGSVNLVGAVTRFAVKDLYSAVR